MTKTTINTKNLTPLATAKALMDIFPKGVSLDILQNQDGTVTIQKAALSISQRRNLAYAVLRNSHAERAEFYRHGNVVLCVLNEDGRTKTGTAVCAPDDYFDYTVGRALAFERACYGKVRATDLL